MEKKSIFVKNYITYCSIGIYANEKTKKQKVKISVILELIKAKNIDAIKSTVSYEKLVSILKEIKNYNHINLLETLAEQITSKLQKIKNIKKIRIEIIKCNILSGDQEVGVSSEKTKSFSEEIYYFLYPF